MRLRDWIPVSGVAAIVRQSVQHVALVVMHSLSVAVAALAIRLGGWAVESLLSGWIVGASREYEQVMFAILLLIWARNLLVVLWVKRDRSEGPHAFVAA